MKDFSNATMKETPETAKDTQNRELKQNCQGERTFEQFKKDWENFISNQSKDFGIPPKCVFDDGETFVTL